LSALCRDFVRWKLVEEPLSEGCTLLRRELCDQLRQAQCVLASALGWFEPTPLAQLPGSGYITLLGGMFKPCDHGEVDRTRSISGCVLR
jgi:hypothetical protein